MGSNFHFGIIMEKDSFKEGTMCYCNAFENWTFLFASFQVVRIVVGGPKVRPTCGFGQCRRWGGCGGGQAHLGGDVVTIEWVICIGGVPVWLILLVKVGCQHGGSSMSVGFCWKLSVLPAAVIRLWRG